MSGTNLRVEARDGVAVVTIHRPEKLNALNLATLDELAAAFASLAGDAGVGGVVVTGSGEKAFVAGADIAEIGDPSGPAGREFSRRGQRVFDAIEQLGKPV